MKIIKAQEEIVFITVWKKLLQGMKSLTQRKNIFKTKKMKLCRQTRTKKNRNKIS